MTKKQDTVALKVSHVNKSFRLPTEQANGIKQAVINHFKGIKGYKQQQVLRNISFTVEKGDFFGIVGRNGSGKSTLLKLISQIYQPDSGKITVNGKLVPFIELGVGFNPELTGRENIYMNGALLGFSREEMTDMYDDIVAFAELDEFMDQKLKNYSSGMQVRLAFSIAIKADADILVLDEVLAVGDEAFQRKCFRYFAELKKNRKTVILVTHSMDHVLKFCNKAALIDKGHKLEVGSPSEIANIYRSINMDVTTKPRKRTGNLIGSMANDIKVTAIVKSRPTDERIVIKTDIMSKKSLEDVAITFVVSRDSGEPVLRWVTDENITMPIHLKKEEVASLTLDVQNIFPSGEYSVQIGVKKVDRTEDFIIMNDAVCFRCFDRGAITNGIYWDPNINHHFNKEDENSES